MHRPEDIERMPAGAQPTAVAVASEAVTPGGIASGTSVMEGRVLTTRQLAWRRFKRHKLAIASAVILILLALACILANVLASYSFSQQVRAESGLLDKLSPPSLKHYFGTDNLGRDTFVRVLYGGRISLAVGLAVALSAGLIGAVTGSISGYYGGWLDNILMRVTDLFLAIPFLVILIIGAEFLDKVIPGSWPLRTYLPTFLILTGFLWMPNARIVRGLFLSLKEKEFVEAARSSGASDKRIIFYHILPNTLGPIIVNVTLLVAAAILTESALSFLGFGVQPPTPTWGNLLDQNRPFMLLAPYLVFFPGLGILITVLCVNFLGDGLRDALDPHQELKSTV